MQITSGMSKDSKEQLNWKICLSEGALIRYLQGVDGKMPDLRRLKVINYSIDLITLSSLVNNG